MMACSIMKDNPVPLLVAPREIRHEILMVLHGTRMSSHLSNCKTLGRIWQHFTWTCICGDVCHWCKQCMACACKKDTRKKNRGLKQQPVGAPLEWIAVDFPGQLLLTEVGNKYVLILTTCAFPVGTWVWYICLPADKKLRNLWKGPYLIVYE